MHPQKAAGSSFGAALVNGIQSRLTMAKKMRILKQFRAVVAIDGNVTAPDPGNYLTKTSVAMQKLALSGAAHRPVRMR